MRLSDQNKFCGTITSITHGAICSQVVLELKEPGKITAIISKEAAEELALTEGGTVSAVVSPLDVMLGLCMEGKAGCKEE